MDDWVSKAIVKTMTDGRCHCQQWRKNSKHKPCVSNTEVSEGDLLKWILCWVSLVVQVISLTRNVCTTAWDVYQAWQHYKRQIHTFPAWERNTHCRTRLTKKNKKSVGTTAHLRKPVLVCGPGRHCGNNKRAARRVEGGGIPRLGQRRTYLGDDGETWEAGGGSALTERWGGGFRQTKHNVKRDRFCACDHSTKKTLRGSADLSVYSSTVLC